MDVASEFPGTDRYEVVSCLGSGSMGTVYKVFDHENSVYVALKVLDTRNADALLRFKHEFRVLQDIQHENLINLGELQERDGGWFFTMELVEGDDFLYYVAGHHASSLDEARLRDALEQLASALTQFHAAGKVHRDVKPSNTIVTAKGRLVLLDFGLALDAEQPLQAGDDTMVGTTAYMAPEQVRGGAGPASDCYAVGVMLYEALTGRLPFSGSAIEVLVSKQKRVPTRPSELVDGNPEDLERLCMDLLEIDPEKRPTAEQIIARVGTFTPVPVAAIPETSQAHDAFFIGRQAELKTLLESVAEPREASAVFIRGPSGVGKSTLMRNFANRVLAAAPGAIILTGRCYERENVPFKGVDGVVDALARWMGGLSEQDAAALLPDNAALLAQVFPALEAVPAFRAANPDRWEFLGPQELRRRVFTALRDLLRSVAEHDVLVVAIDDLQWADPDSWSLLDYIVQPPDPPPLVLVLAMRPPVEGEVTPYSPLPGAKEIELGSLSPDLAEQLAAELMRRTGVSTGGAGALAREAEGHPLFIHQLVRHLAEGGNLGAGRLEDALRARLGRLSEGARNLLDVVATAGMPLSQAIIVGAADLDFADYSRCVTELRIANLVKTSGSRASDTIVHYHDRIRETVLGRHSGERSKQLHTRLANSMEETGFSEVAPELALLHLTAAGQEMRAARYAETAAHRALDTLAFEHAASLYEAAIELGELDDERRRELTLAMAGALAAAGRGVAAAELYLQVSETVSATERLDCLRRAAEQLLTSGHIAQGTAVVARVLADLGEALPATRRAALTLVLRQRGLLFLRGLSWTPREESEIPPRDLMKLDVYQSVSIGLSMVDNIRGASYQCRHVRLALKLGERERVIRALSVEGVFLASVNAHRRARSVRDRVCKWAQESGSASAMAYARFAVAGVEFFIENDWGGTWGSMSACETLLRNHYQLGGWETDTVRMYKCFSLMFLGQLNQLARRYPVYCREAERRGDLYGQVNMRTRLIVPHLMTGDVDGAVKGLEDALDAWVPWDETFLVQHFFALHSWGELALYAGRPKVGTERLNEQFGALKGSMMLRVPIVAGEIAYVAGRLAVAEAEVTSGSVQRAHLARARRLARQLKRSPLPAPRLWAMLLRAGIKNIAGDPESAVATLRRAVTGLAAGEHFLYERAASYFLSRALGGDEGAELGADVGTWMREHAIADPEQFAYFLAPGLRGLTL